MPTQSKADKEKPDIELRDEEAKRALAQNNPIVKISQAINNHAQKINEVCNETESLKLDVKAGKATMEIFEKRFGLVERQLDNIERELSRIQKILKEK